MTNEEVSKKTNKKNHTNQKGITLIALVITIIVMLILVAVTVTVAINGGLFGMAKKAKADTEEEQTKENILSTGRVKIDDTWYDSMEDYVNGTPSKNQNDDSTGGGSEMLSYGDTPKNEGSGTLTDNALWTEENGKTAVIPKGFKVVDGKDGEGDQSIAKGLVIEDAEGNQFVWIPVTYEATGELDDHELDSGFLAVFYRSEWSNNARTTGLDADYTEPYASGYQGEDTDYYAMMKSVQYNGGFYIGRYEAGSTTPRKDCRYNDNKTTTMVVKRDQYPYNNVGWGNEMNYIESDVTNSHCGTNQGKGAVYLSKHMYDGKDVGVTSTLCYGVEWDAMLDFIKDDTHWVTSGSDYCETWGNYPDNPWTITNTKAKSSKYENSKLGEWTDIPSDGLTKTTLENYLLTTGASDSFAAKNIYDVAENCNEWTMEAGSTNGRVKRGGDCTYGGSHDPASGRNSIDPDYTYDFTSFRPALYIKNISF